MSSPIARQAWALIASLVACGLLIGGCGDEDDPPATAEPLGTGATGSSGFTADFTSEADEICEEAGAALANLTEGLSASTEADQKLAITEGLIDSLESLGSPETNPDEFADFLNALQDAVSALEEQQLAADREDQLGIDEAEAEYQAALGSAKRAGRQFGFEECGQEGKTIEVDGTDDVPIDGIGGTTPEPPTTLPPTETTPPPVITPPVEEPPVVEPPVDEGDSGGVDPPDSDTGGVGVG